MINHIIEGEPADKAGLQNGDVVLEVNGKSILDKSHKKAVKLVKSYPNQISFLIKR